MVSDESSSAGFSLRAEGPGGQAQAEAYATTGVEMEFFLDPSRCIGCQA